MRSVEMMLDTALPEGVGAGLPVAGTIAIDKLENVLYVGRPIHSNPSTSISLFKPASDGSAMRVGVKLGAGQCKASK
jgi:HlyD family secretion protein